MLTIGITGGSGCGKSTVSELFCKLGANAIDADTVYHKLLNESPTMMRELCNRFPEAVENGRLNRRALASIVFSDVEALADLNRIAHKFVIEETEREMARLYEQNAQYLCVDAIALFESGLSSICDVTIGVTAPRKVRRERIMARDGIDSMAASARINAQPEDSFYAGRCDYIIENSGDMEAVENEVNRIFNIITKGPEKNNE
ncbi:MAG: dephospho-CoA kinase [Oscillospiraceae bacterium]|nr:dephospho-CoA kinase [Oscillospiraceae bacterium]